MEKSLRMKNQKRKKVTGKKRKKRREKKNWPKEERKSTILSRKEKTLWKRQVLAGLHAVQISNKKSPANQNLPHIMFKTRFPFLYASTSLDTKTLTIASNRNFESCMSIRCLAPQPGSWFFFPFFAVVFLCLWQLCSLLCRPPQRSLSDRDIKKGVSNGLLFSGNLDPSSLTPRGPVLLLVWGFKRRRDNLLAWRELFANLYELKSCIRFWEEYNHFYL